MAPKEPIKAEPQMPLTAPVAGTQSFDMEGQICNVTQAVATKLQAEAKRLEARAVSLQGAAKNLQARAANVRAAAERLQAAAAILQPVPTPAADTHCALLELPAELRNRIYRYTLVDRDCIMVHVEDCTQPALLRTCHQIRTEAPRIFYSENKFELAADSPIPTAGLPHWQHWLWTMPGRAEFNVWVNSNVKWELFKRWLQLIHRGAIHVAKFYTEDAVGGPLNQALSIVRDYRGLPWSMTAYQLEEFRRKKRALHRGRMHPSMLWC